MLIVKKTHKVAVMKKDNPIDGNWDKSQWKDVEALPIANYMGKVPSFSPVVNAKIAVDDEAIYVIFRVEDCFIRCLTNEINGPVWEDSCVEFFFAPDTGLPENYFNLEMNCGGTPLMHYNAPDREMVVIPPEEIKMIQIFHTMPEIIDPEITVPTTWINEYRIPFKLIEKYADISKPTGNTLWHANFYKIAENNSNPHYMTWSFVKNDTPNFHLPKYFGDLYV